MLDSKGFRGGSVIVYYVDVVFGVSLSKSHTDDEIESCVCIPKNIYRGIVLYSLYSN